MSKKNTIYFVGGNREIKTGGGANVSLSSLEKELSKLNFQVCDVGSSNDPSTLSFGKIGHISFNPMLNISLINVYTNWKDTFSLLFYCYKTTHGLALIRGEESIVVNNGIWCLNSDIVVIRFLMKSYLKHLTESKLLSNDLNILDLKSRVILWLEKRILYDSRVKKIVMLSDESKNDFVLNYKGLAKKIRVIPNGVNKNMFIFSANKRDETRKKLGINSKEVIVLFIGGNIFRKNFQLALDTSRSLYKNIKMVVLVKDDEVDRVKALVRKEDNIIMAKWGDDPSRYYNAGDILIFPTIYDTGTKVILEALVNGLYCLVSKDSGVGNFIGKNEGIIIEKSSTDLYVNAIEKYMLENKERSKIGGSKVLSWKEVAKKWNEMIGEI